MIQLSRLLSALVFLTFIACQASSNESSVASVSTHEHSVSTDSPALLVSSRPDGWDDYWYSGKAEVNTYKLTQSRYGEIREGNTVMVFVTEPFFPEQQVKDDGLKSKEQSISVFKLNRLDRFVTGIYDYSIMLSVFTPVSRNQYPHTLKSTFSSQDWCGHVWLQLNRRNNKYQLEGRSYFQKEGDIKTSLDADFLEDELVSLVRLDPAFLPSGKTKVIPASKFERLNHVPAAVENAVVSFSESETEGQMNLRLEYSDLKRVVEYQFEAEFPNKLLGWKETLNGQFMSSGELIASKKETYWSQNSHKFDEKRAELGLPAY